MTFINVFAVEPERQALLVKLLLDATEHVMSKQPGFISARLHRSLDGTHVVNYARWRDRAAFEAIFSNPDAVRHMRAIREIAYGDGHVYDIVAHHVAAQVSGDLDRTSGVIRR